MMLLKSINTPLKPLTDGTFKKRQGLLLLTMKPLKVLTKSNIVNNDAFSSAKVFFNGVFWKHHSILKHYDKLEDDFLEKYH